MGIAHRVFEKNKLRLHVDTSCEQQQASCRWQVMSQAWGSGPSVLVFEGDSPGHCLHQQLHTVLNVVGLFCSQVFCLSVMVLNSANCNVILFTFNRSSDSLVWSKWLNCLKSMTIIPWSCWAKLIPQFPLLWVLQLFPSFYDCFTSFSYQDFLIVPSNPPPFINPEVKGLVSSHLNKRQHRTPRPLPFSIFQVY